MNSTKYQRVPEEGEHQETHTGSPTGVDIQSKQPHPKLENRQCSRTFLQMKAKEHVTKFNVERS